MGQLLSSLTGSSDSSGTQEVTTPQPTGTVTEPEVLTTPEPTGTVTESEVSVSSKPTLEDVIESTSVVNKIKELKLLDTNDFKGMEMDELKPIKSAADEMTGKIQEASMAYMERQDSDEWKLLLANYQEMERIARAADDTMFRLKSKKSKKPRVTGLITLKNSTPTRAEPVLDNSAFPGVDYLVIEVNGKTYRMYAGQNFLNFKYSCQLYESAPTKKGNILIYQAGEHYPNTSEEYHGSEIQ